LTSHVVRLEVYIAYLRVDLFSSNVDTSRINANEERTWIFNVDFDITSVYNAMNNAFPLALPKHASTLCSATLQKQMPSLHREVQEDVGMSLLPH
jgi:hypothetical protein